jgi:hypothetical protein
VASLAKLLIKHKNKYFMRELENELSEFKASKKLMKEIDEAYSKDLLEKCFSGLENKKQFSQKSADLMIDQWFDISGLQKYIHKNYSDDWVAIHDVIHLNLSEELMNVHYDIHN